jgi:hypothetical protein
MPQVSMLDALADAAIKDWFDTRIGRIAEALGPHIAG